MNKYSLDVSLGWFSAAGCCSTFAFPSAPVLFRCIKSYHCLVRTFINSYLSIYVRQHLSWNHLSNMLTLNKWTNITAPPHASLPSYPVSRLPWCSLRRDTPRPYLGRANSYITTTPFSYPMVPRTFLLREPWPCNPAAETALQPQSWCSESSFSQMPASPEVSFSQTPVLVLLGP